MHGKAGSHSSTLGVNWSLFNATLAMPFAVSVVLLINLAAPPASGQTFQILHNFTGGQDGVYPASGVTMDRAGSLYGTTYEGGSSSYGVVYKLQHRGSGWILNPLYEFSGANDGGQPLGGVVFGPDGALYGTTFGEGAYGGGNVFRLTPQPRACTTSLCPWIETVPYSFRGDPDGSGPAFGDLAFDPAGNIYGTTFGGGVYGYGVVYELTPAPKYETEDILHSFKLNDGVWPMNGVILDSAGNLYGTAHQGGPDGVGTAFQLTCATGCTESVLHSFGHGMEGVYLTAGLVFDQSGNLYGAATYGGTGGGGTVFQLSPPGSWTTITVLHSFVGPGSCPAIPILDSTGSGPEATLTIDGAGNLYGTTCADGTHAAGNVFKLTPSNGSWSYTDLYDFTGGSDGAYPLSNVIVDSSGNLYGTASEGGQGGGVVWEITQ